MKKRTNRHARRPSHAPASSYQFLDIAPFLNEIERKLPAIEGQEHRAIVEKIRGFLVAHSMLASMTPNYRPPSFDLLLDMIETLRCAGIAPPGWPQPPGRDALLRTRFIFVPGWDATEGIGGPP